MDNELDHYWSDVRVCRRCHGLSGAGNEICAICRFDDFIVQILKEELADKKEEPSKAGLGSVNEQEG